MSNIVIYDTYNVNVTIEEDSVICVQVVEGFIHDVIAGTNITIDKSDPLNPVISSSGGGGGGTWGSITGTLSDQTDLQSALDETVPVTKGGTNATSLTAYAPIFGGTTSTGTVQSGTVGTAGEVLTSNGAGVLPTFQAAPAAFVYNGIAYVDGNAGAGTGILGRMDRPFQTIDEALDAGVAVTYLKIIIGMGNYAKPTAAKIDRANLWLLGSGKPGYNWTVTQSIYSTQEVITDPTALVGGTVIQGNIRFNDRSNVIIENLGIDVGSAFIAGGGTVDDGISFASSASLSPPFTLPGNIQIKNVTVLLPTAASAYHCILLQPSYEPYVQNVDTYFGFFGLVMKTMGGIADGIRSYKHGNQGIYILSDSYSYAKYVTLTNFSINYGTGLRVSSSSESITGISVSNGHIRNTTSGAAFWSTNINTNSNLSVSNVMTHNTSDRGFDIATVSNLSMSNCIAFAATTNGFRVVASGTNTSNILDNCKAIGTTGTGWGFNLSASGSNSYVRVYNSHANTGTFGFVVNTVQVQLSNVAGTGNTQQLIGGSFLTSNSVQYGNSYFGTFGANVAPVPSAKVTIASGTPAANSAPLKIEPPTTLTITGISTSGGVVTLTFAAQTTPPFQISSRITVAGVTPSGYNGSYDVFGASTTTVQYVSATTGAMTVAGTVSNVGRLVTPVNGEIERDANYFYVTTALGQAVMNLPASIGSGGARVNTITPTALAANTDNWAPTGGTTASVIRASSSGAINLTGISISQIDQNEITLMNVGANNITLMNDVTSTAANRFLLNADFILLPNDSCRLIYDATSSRWRKL